MQVRTLVCKSMTWTTVWDGLGEIRAKAVDFLEP